MTILFAALLLAAPQAIPRLSSPVEDLAGVLTPAQVHEGQVLAAALERSDSTQVALLIVRTTGGKDIFDYSLEVARLNGLGQRDKSNGVLIVVAVDDRKVRIQVGQGLEGKLTDALSGRIIRNDMIPLFKEGKHGEGALAGMRAVAAAVKGEYKGTGNPQQRKKAVGMGVLVLLILLAMLFSRRGGWGGFFTGYMIGGMMSGGGRGGWGGGGGGGGWSGGGGSFGGGGAGGSW